MNSSKAASRIILLATLATTLLGSFSPTLGFANMFDHSIHARCGNEASQLQFWAPSFDREASGNQASPRSCSFDYSLSLSQTSALLVQGTNISITVSVSLSRGVASPVDVSVRDIPNGLNVGLDPSSGQPPFDSKLTISAGPVSPIGSFSIIVTGSNPTAGIRTASLSLTVNQPPTGPAPSSSLTSLGLGTEAVILVSLGETLLALFIIGRRIRGNPRKPAPKTKR